MKKKQIVRLTESDLHNVIKESVKKVLNEIEVVPPKRKYFTPDVEKRFQDNGHEFKSQFPKDWLTDYSLSKAYEDEDGVKTARQRRSNKIESEKKKNQFTSNGFNRKTGLHQVTNTNFDENGFNVFGFDKEGFDKNGFDKNGFGKDGFDRNGFDRNGFDKNGSNLGKSSWKTSIQNYLSKRGGVRICSKYRINAEGAPTVSDFVFSQMEKGRSPFGVLNQAAIKVAAKKEAINFISEHKPNGANNNRLISAIAHIFMEELSNEFYDIFDSMY